jgi:hypothetical protein
MELGGASTKENDLSGRVKPQLLRSCQDTQTRLPRRGQPCQAGDCMGSPSTAAPDSVCRWEGAIADHEPDSWLPKKRSSYPRKSPHTCLGFVPRCRSPDRGCYSSEDIFRLRHQADRTSNSSEMGTFSGRSGVLGKRNKFHTALDLTSSILHSASASDARFHYTRSEISRSGWLRHGSKATQN